MVARGPSIGLRDASGFSPAQPRVCVGFGGRLASSPSQPRDATAPPAPALLRLPQLVASSSGLCARRPSARRPSPHPAVSAVRPSPHRPVRASRAPLQAASGGPRRQHLPPAARLAACSLPRPVDGGGGSRRGRGAAAGGRRAEAAGGRPRGLRRPYAAAPERPEAWSAGHRRPASLHARLPWRVALFHWYCSALGHLSGWLRH